MACEGVPVRGGVGEDTREGGRGGGGAEGKGALEEGGEGVAGLRIDQEIHREGGCSVLERWVGYYRKVVGAFGQGHRLQIVIIISWYRSYSPLNLIYAELLHIILCYH